MLGNSILFLNFSDSAKYADIARNILAKSGSISNFNFWGTNNANWIQPFTPYSNALFFNIFGVNDFAVIATSLFYFSLALIFVYLLTNKIFKNKLTSFLATIAVAFNYNLINYATSGASESPFIFELLAGTYFLSLKKWWGNAIGFVFLVFLYFTRPQAIIYIFGLALYYFINNFSWKKGIAFSGVSFLIGTVLYMFFSKQGLIAVTQNLPGMAVSDSLRGSVVNFNLIVLFKKVFYNLYNFYKAIPEIMNPYLFALFVIGLFKKASTFKVSVAFMVLLTFFVTALTIPFYRYLHPIIPFVYIVGVGTLVQIISSFAENMKLKSKLRYVMVVSTVLVLFFAVGQTLGVLLLDSRFERKLHNTDKDPIYVEMSYKLKEITGKDDVILTNLDTWGSWYGERKTVWFPLEPEMIIPKENEIDAIYLTSYKMDDENYYMGEKWREIFNNPKEQKILPNYKFVGEYEFRAEDNYEREVGRAILLKRIK